MDDRRTWVLGFNNDAKVEHYLQLRRAAEAGIAQLDEELGTLIRAEQAQRRRLTALEEVLRVEWSAVDVATRKKALSAAESDRATLLAGDGDLRKAQTQLAEAEQALQKTQEHWQQASQTLAAATSELQRLQAAVAELDGEQIGQVPEGTAEALRAEFAEHRTQRTVTHHSIETDARRVANALNARIRAAAEEQSAAAQRITEITVNFRNDWPAAALSLIHI